MKENINEKGYKVLDSHVGAIYGDSITLERAEEICERLEAKGFCSTNIVLGIGSYTYQMNTRDTFGFAVKATYGEVVTFTNENEAIIEERQIFKDPITDDGTKKSAKGLLQVVESNDTYILRDQVTLKEETQGALKTVYKDGEIIVDWTLQQIRDRLNSYKIN